VTQVIIMVVCHCVVSIQVCWRWLHICHKPCVSPAASAETSICGLWVAVD